MKRGVRARRLIPSFPTKTFPNHYTIVTGLYPGHHGLVANDMWDPVFESGYSLGNREAVRDARWYGGEPIWVTAERQGQRTAPFFWPGSEADISGVGASYRQPYDGGVSHRARVQKILDWLDLPPEKRPSFLTLYFSAVDDAAHDFGPRPSRQLRRAIRRVDRALGRLVRGLKSRQLEDGVDLVVVSDHGMAATSPERAIAIDRYIDLETVMISDWNPVLAIWTQPERVEETYRALVDAHPRLSVFKRDEIPERLHFRGHRRIAPIIGIADDGWSITTRDALERCPECLTGGNHGFDPALESMGALFVAAGPSFVANRVVEPFENIHIYELLCRILGLEPAANDGDPQATRHLLRGVPTHDPAAAPTLPSSPHPE